MQSATTYEFKIRQLTPEPPLTHCGKGPTSTVPTAPTPAHPSSCYPESVISAPPCPNLETTPPQAIVEPPQTVANLPPTPFSPLALTHPTPKRQPPQDSICLEETDMDHYKKGLNEQKSKH